VVGERALFSRESNDYMQSIMQRLEKRWSIYMSSATDADGTFGIKRHRL
jgi:hypothetical protein